MDLGANSALYNFVPYNLLNVLVDLLGGKALAQRLLWQNPAIPQETGQVFAHPLTARAQDIERRLARDRHCERKIMRFLKKRQYKKAVKQWLHWDMTSPNTDDAHHSISLRRAMLSVLAYTLKDHTQLLAKLKAQAYKRDIENGWPRYREHFLAGETYAGRNKAPLSAPLPS